jgi:hypothetical protein
MPDTAIVFGRMFILRCIAAANVPASQANPQVNPGIPGFQAVLAPLRGRLDVVDLIEMFAACCHFLCSEYGWNRWAHALRQHARATIFRGRPEAALNANRAAPQTFLLP